MEIQGAFVTADDARDAINKVIAKSAEQVLGLSGVGDSGVESMAEIDAEVKNRVNQSHNYVGVLNRLAKQRGLDLGSSEAQGDPDVMDSIAARKAKLGIKTTDAQQAAAGEVK